MDVAGPTAVGGYQLDDDRGHGPHSEVWRAHRIDGDPREVAVKRARRAGVAPLGRLRAEAEILADLDLPNVVRVLDVVADGGDVAIVMELARGGSLDELLARQGRLPAGEVVAVVAPLALALGAGHRRGLLHGDIKPANILFGDRGEPLLADFGVARHVAPLRRRPGGQRRRTWTRSCSPRVGPIRPTTSTRSASSAYVALTGRLPHDGATDQEILDAAARGAHRPLLEVPDVPPLLAAAVEAALARDLAVRPPSAEYFAATLRAAVAPDSVVLPAAPSPGVVAAPRPPEAVVVTRSFGPQPVRPVLTPTPSSRRAGVIGLLAVAAVLAGAGVVAAKVDGNDGRAPGPSAAAVLDAGSREVCPDVDRIPLPAAGRELSADLAGNGCPVPIVWDGSVMQFRLAGDAAPRRYDFKVLGAGTRVGRAARR